MKGIDFYPSDILEGILSKDKRFKELIGKDLDFVGNFRHGDLTGDFQVDEVRNSFEEIGYIVEIAKAYNIKGKPMSDSNSVWVKKKKQKRSKPEDIKMLFYLREIQDKFFRAFPREERKIILENQKIRDKGLKKGVKVKYILRKSRVQDITWDGKVVIVFNDKKEPKQRIVSPFLVERI